MTKRGPHGLVRHAAVLFRRKIYVGGTHRDALDLAFAGFSRLSLRRAYDRVEQGKEEIVFGLANEDGEDWIECSMQSARKLMHGFDCKRRDLA